MAGDYTRVTFDPVRGFSGLHKQQGRVSLDWEFNEFEEILDRRDRAETLDSVGPTFVPATTPDAFKIGVGGAGQLTIERGRVYVDGILVECFGDMSTAAATERDDHLGGVRGPAPVDYDKQPFFYEPNYPALSAGAGDVDLVYLDVWQREVTVFEDPSLREIALNGPDTATRVQTAWQVKILQDVPSSSCSQPPPEWTALTAASTGRMTAQTTPVAPSPGPCVINPAGGYTGLENRLYRVEIHKAGTVDGTTAAEFKWSRDNASLAARVLSIVAAGVGQSTITVASTGRDAWTRFETGDHIELLDDYVEWAMRESNSGGAMAKVISVNHATGEILVDTDLSTFAVVQAQHTRIRRWDNATGAEPLTRPTNDGTAIPLEDGISVTFGPDPGDSFHAGDYWVFAARTADGTIELVDNAPPRGVLHHFMQLALVTAGSPPVVSSDCRNPPQPEPPTHEGCCTRVVKPGESIQAAIDSLPAAGGCVCLKVGTHQINVPILIRRSNVVLHGESIGALVSSESSRVLLRIGGAGGGDDVGASVHDVMVHDIHFRTSNGPPDEADPNRDAIINVTVARRISIHDCTLQVVEQPLAMAGVVIFGSDDVRVERNVIENVQVGVRALRDSQAITVRDNLMSGFMRETVDLGLIGVTLVGMTGRCEVSANHLRGFGEGVELLQLPNAPGSLVVANVIERSRPPSSTDPQLWGIDVSGTGVVVRDNAIAINELHHGGIHSIGSGVHIEHNDISSSVKDGQPRGILFEGRPVDGWITDNRLRGQLIAITVLGGSGAQVVGNDLRLNGRASFGILLDDCQGTLVASNEIVAADQAILVQSGGASRITGNRMSDGFSGVMVMKTEGVVIADNVISNMQLVGVDAIAVLQTTTISRNRLNRCVVGTAEIGAIVAREGCDEVMVEFNDVLDTGLVTPGKLTGDVYGIDLEQCARSRVEGNHVWYSAPDVLNRGVECRALRLEPASAPAPLDHTANNWTLVLDNSFVGVGRSALVEVIKPLTRLTFSNNYSEHYSIPNDRLATVSIHGDRTTLMTVHGNQTKAEPPTNSFNFNGAGQLTFMGNIGFRVIDPPPVVTPPIAGFNIFL